MELDNGLPLKAFSHGQAINDPVNPCLHDRKT